MSSTSRPASSRRAQACPSPGRVLALWFGLLGGQMAWFAQLMLVYMLVPAACVGGTNAPLHAVTALTGAAAAASVLVAFRVWRGAGSRGSSPAGDPRSRSGFMGLTGVLLGALAVYAIVMTGVSPLVLGPCE